MSKRITEWHRASKIQMAYKDITYAKMEEDLGLSRSYLSALINGRIYSDKASKQVSDYLGIPDGDFAIEIKYKPAR